MIMDDPGPAIFEADPEDEYRLSFTVPDLTSRLGRRTLMTMRCFEEEKLRGAIVWLGEHQHLWPEWRVFAKAEGGNALSGHLVDLIAKDSLKRFGSTENMFELCLGATATHGSGKTDVKLSMTLATRSAPIITHAFRDERSRDAFMEGLAAEDRTEGVVELAEFALLKGRNALSRKLDGIARERLSATGRTVQ